MPPRLPSRNLSVPQDIEDYLTSLGRGNVSKAVVEAIRASPGYVAWAEAIQAWKAMQEDAV